MEVKKTTVNKSLIASEIDLELPDTLSARQKNKIKDDVGDLLVDFILENVGDAKSPLTGANFPALTKEYKAKKQKEGRGSRPNLEFNGDMLDELEFKRTRDGVKIQIEGNQAPKADGHNNFSGKSDLPRRRFLPDKGESFQKTITREIDGIIAEAAVDSQKIRRRDLRDINSKSALDRFLKDIFPDLSVKDVQSAILLNESLRELFDDFDLLELFRV